MRELLLSKEQDDHGLKANRPTARNAIVIVSCTWLKTCERSTVRPMFVVLPVPAYHKTVSLQTAPVQDGSVLHNFTEVLLATGHQ
jgi:hypothetical protein